MLILFIQEHQMRRLLGYLIISLQEHMKFMLGGDIIIADRLMHLIQFIMGQVYWGQRELIRKILLLEENGIYLAHIILVQREKLV